MKKIREQVLPKLWASEWWDIGHGHTALVQTQGPRSTIHVLTKVGDTNRSLNPNVDQPKNWETSQSIDVTEKIASLASINNKADLVLSNKILSDDIIKPKHLECRVEDIEIVLQRLEQVTGMFKPLDLLTLPLNYSTLGITTTFNFNSVKAARQRKKEGA